MNAQTIFYEKATGKIINVRPNTYIRSSRERASFCPGYKSQDVSFLYFPSSIPIAPDTHKVQTRDATHPAILVDASGMPLFYPDRTQQFLNVKAQFKDIIVDMADSMGDNLIRASVVVEAQKHYPQLNFYCKVEPQYRDVMALCPDITLFVDHKTHGLDPKQCGLIRLNGGLIADPRGGRFGKACLYGLFMNLPYVPYATRLKLPKGFDRGFAAFDSSIGLRADGHNVVFHLRSKAPEHRSWFIPQAIELARMIKEVYDCTIFYIGNAADNDVNHPDLINLAGKTTWLQTIHLLKSASHRIVIDSAILHICRALELPYVCLWGLLHPWQILGEAPGAMDIVDSREISQTRIKEITPLRVFERVFPEHRKTAPLIYDPAKNVSQHGTQKIIFKYFAEHPPAHNILVDVGAWGMEMSNTFALLELGWKGLLIDANPERLKNIRDDFAGLNVEILNVGCSDARGRFPFYFHKSETSNSFDPDWDAADKTGVSVSVEVFPLDTLLLERNFPFDFDLLSVDAEGMDEKILNKLFASSAYRPRLVVTEIKSHSSPAVFFKRYGYTQYARTGEHDKHNYIFCRED